MLQTPVRVVFNLRPRIPAGVLVSLAVSTVVFSATPFLVPAVAADREVSVGLAGAMSTAQLVGFVTATWGAGRFLRPRRRVMVVAALLGATAQAAAAFSPWFAGVIGAHVVSGLALGLVSWISWAEVFGDDERVGDVAVIGPVVGTVASPILAVALDATGPSWLFLLLAAANLVPLAFVRGTRLEAAQRPHRERHRPTRAAAVILVCLGVITFGGSSVFVFAGAIGAEDVGLGPLAVSLAFSANAIAGIPTARFRGRRRLAGGWMGITGLCAVLVAGVHTPIVFWAAMACWGAAFWMGIPGAFSLLAERSRYPEERAGDAQAVMALGRVFGPLAGGALVSNVSVEALALMGGGAMLAASLVLLYVEARIREFPIYTTFHERVTERWFGAVLGDESSP
jgi:MFS transporter, DHA1 family, chloramphenicol resistance protein